MKLSQALKKTKNAMCIRANAMNITIIDSVPSKMLNASELYLSDNNLQTTKNISQFKNLMLLSLENNKISDIEELAELKNLKKLRELRLKGNHVCQIHFFENHIQNLCENLEILNDKKLLKLPKKVNNGQDDTKYENCDCSQYQTGYQKANVSASSIVPSKIEKLQKMIYKIKNKAIYEYNLIYGTFLSEIFKKSHILTLERLEEFIKTHDYIKYAHKIRYQYIKCDEAAYFTYFRNYWTKFDKNSKLCSNFEELSALVLQYYQLKLNNIPSSHLLKFHINFFENVLSLTTDKYSPNELSLDQISNSSIKTKSECGSQSSKSLSIQQSVVFSEPLSIMQTKNLLIQNTLAFDSIELRPLSLDLNSDSDIKEYDESSSTNSSIFSSVSSSTKSTKDLKPILRVLPEADCDSCSTFQDRMNRKRRRTKFPSFFEMQSFNSE